MKQKLLSFFLLLLILPFCSTACVPTPETEYIPNKGEQKAWQAAPVPPETIKFSVGTEEAPTAPETIPYEQQVGPLYDRLQAPLLWNYTSTEGGVPIVAEDCPVYLPNVDAVPVLTAELRRFTQDDIDAVAEVVFPEGDAIAWHQSGIVTKEQLADLIKNRLEWVESLDPNETDYDIMVQKSQESIAYWEKEFQTAPFAADVPAVSLTIRDYPEHGTLGIGPDRGVNAETTLNGQLCYFRASVDGAYSLDFINVNRGDRYPAGEQPIDDAYGLSMTKADAVRYAQSIGDRLTGGELAVCYCIPVVMGHDEQLSGRWSQWYAILMRSYHGFPSAFATEDVGSGKDDDSVSIPIQYERLTLTFDQQGVTSLKWMRPMRITGIVQPDAEQLLTLEQAAAQAQKSIAAHWRYSIESERERGQEPRIYLTGVTFGLWRIAKKDGGYYYVPVYHFFSNLDKYDWRTLDGLWDLPGTPRDLFLDAVHRSERGDDRSQDPSATRIWATLMNPGAFQWGSTTVNALDGTIINKEKGY